MTLRDVTTKETLKFELGAAREEILQLRKELVDISSSHMGCQNIIAALKDDVKTLQNENKEKTELIHQLQRESNVMLWEKEKEQFLKEANKKISELKEEIHSLKKERSTLLERIQHYANSYKIERLKNEKLRHGITDGVPAADQQQDIKQRDQLIFLLDQDVQRLHSELTKWQKSTVGLFHGLCVDYEGCLATVVHSTQSEPVSVDRASAKRAKWLFSVLNKCKDHAKKATLTHVQAELPEYYIALDKDIINPVKVAAKRGSILSLTPEAVQAAGASTEVMTGDKSNSDSNSSSNGSSNTSSTESITISSEVKTTAPVPVAPVLIDPATGMVNYIVIQKYFPHFTKEYVIEHYKHFKSFDTNKDERLDLIEIVSAMSKTFGQQFTPIQIKDAIAEVDMKGDGTLTFYEFLKVADMIIHKNGRSAIFRSKFLELQGKNIHQTCAVM